VSAQTGEGVDHLLEMILLQADMLELKANPRRLAQGYVIESKLEPGMGPTAHILVSRGTLRTGDTVVCGPHWGRVRALINDRGETVKSCGPSAAVKLLGLSGVPEPGDEFIVHTSERTARKLSEERLAARRLDSIQVVQPKRMTMDQLLNASQEKGKLELRVVLKADTQGSLEAIAGALSGIKSDKVEMKILMQAVGNVSINDVLLANASKAVILGFHVSKDNGVGAAAKREGVEIRLYSIIYEMLDDVKVLMSGLLEPLMRERVLGHAEVRQVFDLSKRGAVAGCVVKSGRVTARGKARILRAGDVLFAGQIASLRRFQNDASEVREGQECGLRVDGFSEYQVGDTIECYDIEKIAQQL
jgi:translation initiation factor IF-2